MKDLFMAWAYLNVFAFLGFIVAGKIGLAIGHEELAILGLFIGAIFGCWLSECPFMKKPIIELFKRK